MIFQFPCAHGRGRADIMNVKQMQRVRRNRLLENFIIHQTDVLITVLKGFRVTYGFGVFYSPSVKLIDHPAPQTNMTRFRTYILMKASFEKDTRREKSDGVWEREIERIFHCSLQGWQKGTEHILMRSSWSTSSRSMINHSLGRQTDG